MINYYSYPKNIKVENIKKSKYQVYKEQELLFSDIWLVLNVIGGYFILELYIY